MRLCRVPVKVANPQAEAASITAINHRSGHQSATPHAAANSVKTTSHNVTAVKATLLM